MAPGLLSLPDGVLERVLGFMSHAERQRAIPLVCQRLRQLADSPALNAAVSAKCRGEDCLPRLRSFCPWLARRRGSMLELSLVVDGAAMEEGDKCEAAALLSAALTACGLAGSLQRLQLVVRGLRFPCSGWVEELRGLRTLALDCGDEYNVTVIEQSLAGLRQLEDLWLRGEPSYLNLNLSSAAGLPLSLTRLHVCNDGTAARMPQQSSQLSRMQALSLDNTYHTPDGYAPLAAMPALRQLSLANVLHAPPCLSNLTRLESLAIYDGLGKLDVEDCDHIQAALPRLKCLTSLALARVPKALQLSVLPPALQVLAWYPRQVEQAPPPLPSGPWLRTLTRLDAPLFALLPSLPMLAGATALRQTLEGELIEQLSAELLPCNGFSADSAAAAAAAAVAAAWQGGDAAAAAAALSALFPTALSLSAAGGGTLALVQGACGDNSGAAATAAVLLRPALVTAAAACILTAAAPLEPAGQRSLAEFSRQLGALLGCALKERQEAAFNSASAALQARCLAGGRHGTVPRVGSAACLLPLRGPAV